MQSSILKQIWHFIVHLRPHYQFFILSGGYLLSALFVSPVEWKQFWLQFLNVHLLLFGGATAYNSYWDKDEGPIGGLKSPPKMNSWMWIASLFLQFAGAYWAYYIGIYFLIIYLTSMLLFWLYSTPLARWKGRPWLSLVAIGGSTGTNSFLMGYLAAGGNSLGFREGLIAFGVASIVLSLYPISQIFQIEEDESRGDITFTMKYGLNGVRIFFPVLFLSGGAIISVFLFFENQLLGLLFGAVSFLACGGIFMILKGLQGRKEEYNLVMRIKFIASFSFVLFILSVLLINSIT